MRIGSHISIRRGYLQAAKTAAAIGATAFQYFPKNPRSLSVKSWDPKDAAACAAYCREHGLISIAHTPYPVNLAGPEGELRRVTVQSLRNDLEIAEACGTMGIIVHFGKSKEIDPLQGYKNILQCLNEALSGWSGSTLLLLENMAGEGSAMGTTLEELVQIRKLSDFPERIGFCLDTCHLFASGGWRKGELEQWVGRGEQMGFFGHLKALHLNDSVYPSGACKDRHAPIGQGHIGLDSFRELLHRLPVRNIPAVLETEPGADGTHREEIALVRGLLP
jgi:deoxyribonuclease IV